MDDSFCNPIILRVLLPVVPPGKAALFISNIAWVKWPESASFMQMITAVFAVILALYSEQSSIYLAMTHDRQAFDSWFIFVKNDYF
jgi:hypothetical protein